MPFKLPSLCQRHPRYSLAIFLLFLCTFFLLHPDVARHPIPVVIHSDPGLRGRLDRAEQKYQDMLGQRKDLIAKFGPTPHKSPCFHLIMTPGQRIPSGTSFPRCLTARMSSID
ncbi:hypothetical protein A0H81_05056 [Grifola frondosa]|uniref:Uncharacterized protein n=1 Tax=Grifola frondosa TaxID=5627 RepID=A0A1C7MCT2_GRIFR|nr:hypothetical protein A0H81_05056 [Grifola frondosa]